MKELVNVKIEIDSDDWMDAAKHLEKMETDGLCRLILILDEWRRIARKIVKQRVEEKSNGN